MTINSEINVVKGNSRGKKLKITSFFKKLLGNWSGFIGFVIIFLLLIISIFGKQIAPYDPMYTDFAKKLLPPLTEGHLLGTDQLGRDVLSRIIVGARVSVIIGLITVLVAGTFGTIIGIISGYFRGWIDVVLMRIVDVQLSFPFILLVLVVSAITGTGLRNIIISLAIGGWVIFARVIRSEVLAIREKEFITACVATGVKRSHILFKHILPNLVTPIIILGSLQIATYIIAEASISFLGFGVQPPTPAWGNMLSEGKDYIFSSWWLITFPGIAILITALGVNLFGDWLRDTLDPEFVE
ncbi:MULTISPECIES: ABC transporter permease [Bacillales]|uniref:ABC transporter permease n=1 Tax=Lysinibacillus louembei TaxID=1470088 RepID=A0ABZ0RTL9_9BACI|nr:MULTISPECIES: ABC transporter permease [Bacillales]MCT6923059.1 ABC transporter permease [Metasolibacillus sp.]MCT6939297.1 ABC transporter permease [Metasolibacillus sp.]WPK10855.1 ABC transporter permease [Lysinibacillus louembei]